MSSLARTPTPREVGAWLAFHPASKDTMTEAQRDELAAFIAGMLEGYLPWVDPREQADFGARMGR